MELLSCSSCPSSSVSVFDLSRRGWISAPYFFVMDIAEMAFVSVGFLPNGCSFLLCFFFIAPCLVWRSGGAACCAASPQPLRGPWDSQDWVDLLQFDPCVQQVDLRLVEPGDASSKSMAGTSSTSVGAIPEAFVGRVAGVTIRWHGETFSHLHCGVWTILLLRPHRRVPVEMEASMSAAVWCFWSDCSSFSTWDFLGGAVVSLSDGDVFPWRT